MRVEIDGDENVESKIKGAKLSAKKSGITLIPFKGSSRDVSVSEIPSQISVKYLNPEGSKNIVQTLFGFSKEDFSKVKEGKLVEKLMPIIEKILRGKNG